MLVDGQWRDMVLICAAKGSTVVGRFSGKLYQPRVALSDQALHLVSSSSVIFLCTVAVLRIYSCSYQPLKLRSVWNYDQNFLVASTV